MWTALVSAAFVTALLLSSLLLHYSGGQGRLKGVDWVGPTERILYDLRVRSRGSMPLSGQVGILNIDDATLQKLGT